MAVGGLTVAAWEAVLLLFLNRSRSSISLKGTSGNKPFHSPYTLKNSRLVLSSVRDV